REACHRRQGHGRRRAVEIRAMTLSGEPVAASRSEWIAHACVALGLVWAVVLVVAACGTTSPSLPAVASGVPTPASRTELETPTATPLQSASPQAVACGLPPPYGATQASVTCTAAFVLAMQAIPPGPVTSIDVESGTYCPPRGRCAFLSPQE